MIRRYYNQAIVLLLGEYVPFYELTRGSTNRLRVQLLRSLVVAFLALAVDFGTLLILVEFFGVHYLVAATIGFIWGIVVNYILSTTWVFSNRKLTSRRREFILFVLIGIAGLLINNSILWILTDTIHIDYRLSKLGATIIVFFWNFFVRKYILY